MLAATSCGLPPIDETYALGSIQRTVLENRLSEEFLEAHSFELWSANQGGATERWPATFAPDGRFQTRAPVSAPAADGGTWKLTGPATVEIGDHTWGYDPRLECLYRSSWCISVRVDDQLLAWLQRYQGWQNLNLSGEKAVTDAGVGQVGQLCEPSLIALQLDGTAVTDEGLSHLSRCSRLANLDLSNTAVSDEGLAALQALPQLAVFRAPPAMTDDGLAAIEGLPSLYHLRLTDTRITDVGLSYLAGTKRLRILDLRRTRVTNAGMERLVSARSLRSVYLPAGVDGEGLRNLVNLPEIERLTFSGPVTENQLRYLDQAPKLRSLRVPAGLSAQVVASLRARAPQLRVLVGDPTDDEPN